MAPAYSARRRITLFATAMFTAYVLTDDGSTPDLGGIKLPIVFIARIVTFAMSEADEADRRLSFDDNCEQTKAHLARFVSKSKKIDAVDPRNYITSQAGLLSNVVDEGD